MAQARIQLLSGERSGASLIFEHPIRIGAGPDCELSARDLPPATIEPHGPDYLIRAPGGVWIGETAVVEAILPMIAKLDFGAGIGAMFEQLGGSYRGEPVIRRACAAPPRRTQPGALLVGALARQRDGGAIAALDDDRVLVAGGQRPVHGGASHATLEVFSVARAESQEYAMLEPRGGATATRLADGRVLIAGGRTRSAELFDPATGRSTPTGRMQAQRAGAMALPLANGLVVMVGGVAHTDQIVAEVYDPARGTFGGLRSPHIAYADSANLDGRHFLIATTTSDPAPRPPSTYLLFDSATWRFEPIAPPMTTRWSPQLTAIGGGRALVTGGAPMREVGRIVEVFDLAARQWTVLGEMRTMRQSPAIVASGSNVFAIGGDSLAVGLYSGEYLDLHTWSWRPLAPIWHGINPTDGFARADGSAVIVGIGAVSVVVSAHG